VPVKQEFHKLHDTVMEAESFILANCRWCIF